MDKTAFLSAAAMEKRYIKRQILFSSLICACAAGLFYLLPYFPFDRKIAVVCLLAAVIYLASFILLGALEGHYHRMVTGLSVTACVMLALVVHLSGGIISPFVFLYFSILISEAVYGREQTVAITFSILSYSAVVLGEASGLLSVRYASAESIYHSPAIVAVILLSVTSFMFITGHISRLVILKLRFELEEEHRKEAVILKRFSELDAYSHIGLLAHRIVHDLKGPLSAISGYVELERMAPGKNEEERAALASIAETVVNMAGSLNNISSFGRASEGKKEKIKMREFFYNLVAIFSFCSDAGKIRFRQSYPDAGEPVVLAVRQDFQQAYFNILKNAMEAVRNNPGDRIIDVSMRESEGMLEVGVTSNGPPVPEEIRRKIFQQAVTGKADGAGVGLLITHDLLRKNNVSVEIRNIAGTGVLVSTRMPMAAAEN
ncbi:MAG: HAMP domain-containing sensor histidine kinase [Elusimicrobiales bacterium]|jgi:signal transduction histidine kinase